MAEPFIGEIRIFPYTYAPRLWAACDGQIIPVNQNPALYSIIGTIYGGSGQTTMQLPNLQGRVPMHSGTGPGLTPCIEGEMKGSNSVFLYQQNLPEHTHSVSGIRRGGDFSTPNSALYPATDTDVNVEQYISISTPGSLMPMSSSALSTAGGGQAHENRQPFLVLQFCIALDGVYPSRN